jgi:hypothetical protein
MDRRNVTVVLAHGAWADGSSWSHVIGLLAGQGQRCVATPLPLTSFDDDVDALDRTIERVGGPVVLVGHAYAGAVIGAARSPQVEALVYVAALAPDEGETVADVFGRDEPHPLAPAIAPDRHGQVWLSDDAIISAFAPDATSEEQTLLAAVQRPIAAACIGVPVARPRWHDLPSWYLIAENDRMIVAGNQRFMADRMGATIASHPVDHLPLFTSPDLVAGLILNVARNLKDDNSQVTITSN